MAQEHTLNFTSRKVYLMRGFLAIIIGLSITLMIATNLGIHLHILVFLGIDVLFTVLLFYFSKSWYKGQLSICFKEKEIQISSYLPLFRHSRQYTFHWSELKDISFADSQYFRIFVIKDQKKKVAFAIEYGDEVTRFEQILNKKISKLNQDELIRTNQKPAIYKTKVSFGIAVVLGLLMVAWPLAAWLNNREFQIGLALIFYAGSMFFIYQVYTHYKA